MPLYAPTASDDFEATDTSTIGVVESGADDARTTVAEDANVAFSSTIAIELNFNAFADHVPPTKHAKRVARIDDPSIQDFADQALEIAALRAELKRLHNDYDNVQHAVRLRDKWLKTLREELSLAQAQLRQAMRQSTGAQPTPAKIEGGTVQEERPAAERIAAPESPTPSAALAVHDLTTTLDVTASRDMGSATIAGVPPLVTPALAAKHRLTPVDHDGPAVLLCRDIMTIGRTRENDIPIPSRAVSRDHARLLIGPHSVTIVDMDSANGCFVNDEPVKRQKLREGDIVRIGDRSYRFCNAQSSA